MGFSESHYSAFRYSSVSIFCRLSGIKIELHPERPGFDLHAVIHSEPFHSTPSLRGLLSELRKSLAGAGRSK